MTRKTPLDRFDALIEQSSLGGSAAGMLKSRTAPATSREVTASADVIWQAARQLASRVVHHPTPIKVMLVEEDDTARRALSTCLAKHEDIIVVASPAGANLIELALQLNPDVVVVDAETDPQALTRISELRGQLPEAQVVALAQAYPAWRIQRLLAGDVLGLVNKNAPAARLLEAVRAAAKGVLVVDDELAFAALSVEPVPLTRRELEVLRLAAEGASGAEIADRLYLSKGTVRNYMLRVISKTNARNSVDAVRIAREAGWI